MTRLEEAERVIRQLTPAEKAELLGRFARDLGRTSPMIESIDGVCGGEPCIVRTRVPVWVLEQARRLGATDAQLLEYYPTLRPADLAAAWAYVQTHRDEIDEQIRANEEA